MKNLLLILLGIIALGFTRPGSVTAVDVYFRELNFSPDSSIHFSNPVFIPGKIDSTESVAIDGFLHPELKKKGSLNFSTDRYLAGNCKGNWEGDQIYIVDFGFTFDDSTMCGQHTQLYKIKKGQPVLELELAFTYCSSDVNVYRDSWFADIDKDGKTDILTREVTETTRLTDSTEEFYIDLVDTLYAWRNVSHELKEFCPGNQDSLKSVYKIKERIY